MTDGDEQQQGVRVWDPARLWLSQEGELLAGGGVGLSAAGEPFEGLSVCRAGSLAGLRHHAWFVRRSDLSDDLVDEHAILLAEQLVDGIRMPAARRWLEQQPVVAVSGAKLERLAQAGVRVFHLAIEDTELKLGAQGGGPTLDLSLSTDALKAEQRRLLVRTAAKGEDASRSAPSGVDRLLRALSGDDLDEASCLRALRIREVLTPGYGYCGAKDGRAAGLGHIERAFTPVEQLFAQIYARAQKQERLIAEVLEDMKALRQADSDSEQQLPAFGVVHSHHEEELVLSKRVSLVYRVDGELIPTLTLPAYRRWFVDAWQPWEPDAPATSEAMATSMGEDAAAPSQSRVLLVVLLLVVFAACAYWLR